MFRTAFFEWQSWQPGQPLAGKIHLKFFKDRSYTREEISQMILDLTTVRDSMQDPARFSGTLPPLDPPA